ncbi:MAG TPA: glycerophosphodiester phosphodiesterase family protein [Bryobacteraceae bacterium]|nr:glycerophosphodiester phosphodiesterase family protein [Bryobacteraceae bacterium]
MFKAIAAILGISAVFSGSGFSQTKNIAVIAHRGEHLSHPENTIEAFAAAAEAGADYFELDVRTTSDGKLVLMHDATTDRMTGVKGEIKSMTFDEVRGLKAGGSRIPSFDEALAFARGRIGVYVDSKNISSADVIDAIERNGMQDRVVIYGNPKYLGEVAAARPMWKVMPEAHNPATLRGLIDSLHLKVAAFDAGDFKEETIAVATAAGVDIYVDRLGAADNPAGWQDAIDRGAAGIQTDHPAELVDYLVSRKYRAARR